MAGFFNSKIRKVQEALGTAQVTEDPQDTKVAKEHLQKLKTINQNFEKYTKEYSSEFDKIGNISEKIGSTLIEYSALYPSTPFSEALLRIGETQAALTNLQKAFASQIQEIMVNHVKVLMDEDLKKAAELKIKQEDARLVYDIHLAKKRELAPKANDAKFLAKIEETDQQLNVSKANYDTFNEQIVNRMHEFDMKSSKDTISTLKQYCRAQEEFFQRSLTLVSQMTPHLDFIEQQNQNYIDQKKQERWAQKSQQMPKLQPALSYPSSGPTTVILNPNLNPQVPSTPYLNSQPLPTVGVTPDPNAPSLYPPLY